MSKESLKHTDLWIKNKNELRINGIISVASFDESFLTLETNEGIINIEGEGLKIESLTKETGEIEIKGVVLGVFYSKKNLKQKRFWGLFG